MIYDTDGTAVRIEYKIPDIFSVKNPATASGENFNWQKTTVSTKYLKLTECKNITYTPR